jgi:hypothetical protein
MEIRNSGEFFGSFVGNKVLVRNLARVHYDTALRGQSTAAAATPSPTRTATLVPPAIPTATPTAMAAATNTVPPTASQVSTCAVDPNGTYVDAEKFTSRANAGTTYSFAGVTSAQGGFVGTGYLKTGATQNQLSYTDVNAAPASYERYDYRLNFPTAGTYTVSIRGWASNSNENSIYIGLDGSAVGALTEWTYGNWVWSNSIYNGSNTITVTAPGFHTINVWPREYNHLLDGVYLSTTTTVPSGGIPSGATVYGQGCSG